MWSICAALIIAGFALFVIGAITGSMLVVRKVFRAADTGEIVKFEDREFFVQEYETGRRYF